MASDSGSETRRAHELIVGDVQALSAESDQLGRTFSAEQGIGVNDFHALLHVMVAESIGAPLTQRELSERVDVSGAAVTYLVDRMVKTGHLRREPHSSDRRKTVLRYGDHGSDVARAFFTPLSEHMETALRDFTVADLETAHHVMAAVIEAMRRFRTGLRDK
jgi:DNA-binding MarR family transcriptional regulator